MSTHDFPGVLWLVQGARSIGSVLCLQLQGGAWGQLCAGGQRQTGALVCQEPDMSNPWTWSSRSLYPPFQEMVAQHCCTGASQG